MTDIYRGCENCMHRKKTIEQEPCKSCTGNIVTPENWVAGMETNMFDVEEIYENCTVQVLKNSVTGEVSVGWWINNED